MPPIVSATTLAPQRRSVASLQASDWRPLVKRALFAMILATVAVLCCLLADSSAPAATPCAELKSLPLGDAKITASQSVPAGPFAVPGSTPARSITLPTFCRVQGVIAPTRDSHIAFEVWLPATEWNGKYQGVGNGAFAGAVEYANDLGGLAAALRAGYAASSTDTGHRADGFDAQWALGHPEKVIDYGYRAVHETAEKSKLIIRAFYGAPARHSHFSSCSNGGREALMEAQRYPSDYDGIIAGAPAANFTRILSGFIWNVLAVSGSTSYIPARKFAAIEAAVVAACDARDGVKDGIIDEPTKCAFDPDVLLCKGPESNACLTSPQIAALKKIYKGPTSSKGEPLYPGFASGGESGLGGWLSGGSDVKQSPQFLFGTRGIGILVFQNASYDYKAFDFDHDVKKADDLAGRSLNAIDPDLSAFQKGGGKLILYHGWSDPALPPTATIDYYNKVIAKIGRTSADDAVRLYMVPSMQHCGDGPGADNFGATPGLPPDVPDPSRNMTAALERWVENGEAPSAIVATKYNSPDNPSSGVKFTRPLCPYPKVAMYKGTGSTRDAANFSCETPLRH
jgi:tannase/feruloyl esterase